MEINTSTKVYLQVFFKIGFRPYILKTMILTFVFSKVWWIWYLVSAYVKMKYRVKYKIYHISELRKLKLSLIKKIRI